MTDTQTTPSKRIKTLHTKSDSGASLKDFAVELGQNGSKDEKLLVEAWLSNKAGEPKKKEAPKPVALPPVKSGGKKR